MIAATCWLLGVIGPPDGNTKESRPQFHREAELAIPEAWVNQGDSDVIPVCRKEELFRKKGSGRKEELCSMKMGWQTSGYCSSSLPECLEWPREKVQSSTA
jgi:hypothetical protein